MLRPEAPARSRRLGAGKPFLLESFNVATMMRPRLATANSVFCTRIASRCRSRMRAQSASVENDLGNGRHIAMSISSPGDISSSYEADFPLFPLRDLSAGAD